MELKLFKAGVQIKLLKLILHNHLIRHLSERECAVLFYKDDYVILAVTQNRKPTL